MWASHFVRNGNKLSISSWLDTEVQVCRNVGQPNPRLPNLVCLYDLFYLLYLYIFIVFFYSGGITMLETRPYLQGARLSALEAVAEVIIDYLLITLYIIVCYVR